MTLIDFLLTNVMRRNFPKLCPASLWALGHCMDKQRFTFGIVVGTNNLRGDPDFLMKFNRYLTEKKQVDPAEYELVTIASCTGHSFVITREIPEGESEVTEYLTIRSYAKYGCICHGTHVSNAQSILRAGLDVDYGVRTGLSRRNVIHFCVATNQRPLKRQGLYCYLDLKVAIGDLGLKVMYSKTAQVVLVEDRVPPEALCLTWKSPPELGSMCLPNQEDLIKPRGRDADQVPVKKVGEIFKASPLLRPRPVSGPATSSLATIAEVEQPIVIDDDEDTITTGDASGSVDVSQKAPTPVPSKRRPTLKSSPSTRPKAVLKSAPTTLTRAPPPVERYVVPKGPAVVPVFDISDFPTTLPGLPSSIASSIASSPATTFGTGDIKGSIAVSEFTAETNGTATDSEFISQAKGTWHQQESRCRLRLTQSCEKLRRRELRGQPTNNNSMMQCCPPSSSQSLRTQFQTAQSGFIPHEERTAWGVTFPRSLTSGHCQRESRMTS